MPMLTLVPKKDDNVYLTMGSYSYFNGYVLTSDGVINYKDWKISDAKTIFGGARSINGVGDVYPSVFFINETDELWAVGSNRGGILGDNTGVDKEEPVKILNEIAQIRVSSNGLGHDYIVAITNEGTVYKWGNDIYAPEQVLDNVVDIIQYDSYDFLENFFWISTDGTLRHSGYEDPILYKVKKVCRWGHGTYWDNSIYVIMSDDSLWSIQFDSSIFYKHNDKGDRITYNRYLIKNADKILDNVEEFSYTGWGSEVVNNAVLKNGELMAWGANKKGQLGDGTKIDRDEPVKITDNVRKRYWPYLFVKNNGTLWGWNSVNPTPILITSDVDEIVSSTSSSGDRLNITYIGGDGKLYYIDIKQDAVSAPLLLLDRVRIP